MLNGHGNSHFNIKEPIQKDFSSNIWYRGLNTNLSVYLESTIHNVVNYPVVDAINLQQIVANSYGLTHNSVCITNGATEAFYLIAHAFSCKKSLIVIPSFSEYNDAPLLYKHSIETIRSADLDKVKDSDANLVWIGNPNNPDGKVLQIHTIEELLKENKEKVFVIDEAYAEVCNNFNSAISLISQYDNVIIVKSMTKQCVIPGLRLGYFIANEALRDKVAAYRMPWSVNSIALDAGSYIFNHLDDFTIDTKELKKESLQFQNTVNAIDGIEVIPSETNYFLCKLINHKAADLQSYLIGNYGFLIREASNFEGLDASYFRLAIQGEDYNIQCANAIKEFVSK